VESKVLNKEEKQQVYMREEDGTKRKARPFNLKVKKGATKDRKRGKSNRSQKGGGTSVEQEWPLGTPEIKRGRIRKGKSILGGGGG